MSSAEYRVVVCGEGGVGKSAISVQYISAHFVEVYDPTIEDSYRKQSVIDEEPALVHIRDTAGQEQYSCLREAWYRDGEGFLLVYAMNDRKSFQKLREHSKQIARVRDTEDLSGVPILLFGNKSDLEVQRQVSLEDAKAYAAELGAQVLEGSAKRYVNINEAMEYLVRAIRAVRDPALKPGKGPDTNSGRERRASSARAMRLEKKKNCHLL